MAFSLGSTANQPDCNEEQMTGDEVGLQRRMADGSLRTTYTADKARWHYVFWELTPTQRNTMRTAYLAALAASVTLTTASGNPSSATVCAVPKSWRDKPHRMADGMRHRVELDVIGV